MTPASCIGFGLGVQQFALYSRGHGTGHDGPARPGRWRGMPPGR